MFILVPIILATATLILCLTVSWGFLLIPGIPALVTTIFWYLGLPEQQEDRDQLDCVIDLFAEIDNWNLDGNWAFYKDCISIYDDPVENTITIKVNLTKDRQLRIEANRAYRHILRTKIAAVKDAQELNAFVRLAANAQA